MATWKNISESEFKEWFHNTYDLTLNNKAYVVLQYDSEVTTQEKIKLRFQFKLDEEKTENLWDTYYLLLNPEDSDNRKLIILKGEYTRYKESHWPYTSTETLTLTKSYNEKTFSFPSFWICNYNNILPSSSYVTNLKSFYTTFNGTRKTLRTAVAAQEISLAKSVTAATNGTAPNINIKDNGNNTVQLYGTLGTNGTNNAMQSATIYYTTDSTDPEDSSTRKTITLTASSGTGYSKSISIASACAVKAYVVCKFKYNTTSCAVKQASIKYYKAPSAPGKPELAPSSFKNNRLTIKQDWGWQWGLASQANTSSPVKGYRVRLFVTNTEGTFTNNPIVNYYTGDTASKELTDNDWAYDRTSTDYPMPMRASDQDIEPKDKVKLSIQAYTINGAGTKLLSAEVFSDVYEVQKAGIVRVKVGTTWKEGQVFVKVGGAWKEAETVNVKVGGAWKESE